MIKNNVRINKSKVINIEGLTFKENCSDLRNSKVIDIVNELKEYGIDVYISDQNSELEILKSNNINLSFLADMHNLNVKVFESSNEIGGQINLFRDKPVYDMPALNNVNGLDIMNAFVKQLQFATKMESIHYEQEVLEIKGEYNNFIVKTKIKQNFIFF